MEKTHKITIRPLQESDLPAVDRIFRLAFGTFFQIPDPTKFRDDVDYARTRWLADPDAVFVAESDGEIAGSNFATNWGSVGFFGPTTVRPDLWNHGIGSRGQNAGQVFDHLLDACESLAKAEGMERIVAGVNMENHEAYRNMLAIGFRADSIGVAMHKPNEPGYNNHDVYVVNDWM